MATRQTAWYGRWGAAPASLRRFPPHAETSITGLAFSLVPLREKADLLLLSANDILLFLGFAALTALSLWMILRPLRGAMALPERAEGESEIALYRDQLDEVARDLERGVIGEKEAQAARIEVSRRLIVADEARIAAERSKGVDDPRWRKVAAISLVLFVPLCAIALYLMAGSPGLPGQPIAARLNVPAEELPVEGLIARVERRLKENPQDIEGWESIAPAYLMLGRYDDAARAWTRAMLVDGVTAARLAARAEARVLANNGTVSAGARDDLEKAVALDAGEPRAQFLLGMAELEAGDREAALARWKALVAGAPEDAQWVPAIRARIAAAEGRIEIAPEDEPLIRGMMEGLAARLEDEPNDLEGWLRLIHAYKVLAEDEQARNALATARATFGQDADALARLDEAEAALDK